MARLRAVLGLAAITGAGCGFRTSLDQPGAVAVNDFTCSPSPTVTPAGPGLTAVQGQSAIPCQATLQNTAALPEPVPSLAPLAMVGGVDDSSHYHLSLISTLPQSLSAAGRPGDSLPVSLLLDVDFAAAPGSGELVTEGVDPRGPASVSAPIALTVLQAAHLALVSQQAEGPTCAGIRPTTYSAVVQNIGQVRAVVDTSGLETLGDTLTVTPWGTNPLSVEPSDSATFSFQVLATSTNGGDTSALLSLFYSDAFTGVGPLPVDIPHSVGALPLSVSAPSPTIGVTWGTVPASIGRGTSGYSLQILVHNSNAAAAGLNGAALDMTIGAATTTSSYTIGVAPAFPLSLPAGPSTLGYSSVGIKADALTGTTIPLGTLFLEGSRCTQTPRTGSGSTQWSVQ